MWEVPMTDQDLLHRVVERLHEAALGDVDWTAPASIVNRVVRTSANNIAVGYGPSRAEMEFRFARSCFGSQRRRDVEERYLTHFVHVDEAIPRILRLPDGQLTPTGELYTEREKKTSPVYNGSRRIQNGLYVRLDGPDGSHIAWGIADSTAPGTGWSATQTEMIRYLVPHVRQYATVRGVLEDARALGSSLAGLLDNGRCGVIQLDRRARIVAASDRARELLKQRGGLSDRDGFLAASSPRDNDILQRLLAGALAPFGVPPEADSVAIRRPAARTRLVLHITPVTGRAWDVRAQRVAVLVLVVDPESRPRIDARLVASALDLTPAEGRLAAMVAAGRTVRDIAAATERTEGTVRWHLKRIFRKQGISRQADLVRRVLSLEVLPAIRRSPE